MRPRVSRLGAVGLVLVLTLALGGLALASSGGAEGAESQKVWDLIWRIMNFAAVVAVLVILLRKPLGQALRGRREGIREELERLEAHRAEAQAELAQAQAELSALAAERDKVLAEYVAQGEAEKARILAEAEAMAERLKDQARKRIELELQAAKKSLTAEVAEAAMAQAAELVKKNISAADHERLRDESLSKMVGEA
jgi:F-type H+-transporting ATPase subunit b